MAYYQHYAPQSRRSRSRDSSMRQPGPSQNYPFTPAPPVVIISDPYESYGSSRQSYVPQQGYESSRHSPTPQPHYTYIPPTSSFSGGSRSPRTHSPVSIDLPHRGTHDEFDHASSSYVAVDPFRPTIAQQTPIPSQIPVAPPPIVNQPPQDYYGYYQHPPVFAPPPYLYTPIANTPTLTSLILHFLFDTIPRQIYLHFLLRLPAFYFSRVTRIFEEAEMAVPEIKKMALAHSDQKYDPMALQPADSNLKITWETFVDTLIREWKTLNIVSVLLLSAILTILQIEAAAADPITRHAALFSLICALMSLLYGCMYIIRFGTMKKTHKAAEWAEEGQKNKTVIFWNVWVLLSMPAAWLAWSIILYIVCIMAFVWRTGTVDAITSSMLSQKTALGPRVAISAVLGLGVLYFLLILNTFRRYGDVMDKAWRARVAGWRQMIGYGRGGYHSSSSYSRDDREYTLRPSIPSMESSSPPRHRYPTTPFQPSMSNTPTPLWSDFPPGIPTSNILPPMILNFFTPAKILDLRFQSRGGQQMPDHLVTRGIKHEDWERFITEASRSWDIGISRQRRSRRAWDIPPRPQDIAAEVIEKWNMKFFMRRGTRALLCQEYMPGFSDSPAFAIYLVDWTSLDNQPFRLVDRFFAVPEGLERIDIFDPPTIHSARSRILGRTSIFSTRHPTEGRVHFGVSLRNVNSAQEPAPPHPMTRATHESSGGTYSRSPSRSPDLIYQQGDRMRFSQRSRSREPSPRNRRPWNSRSRSRSAPSRSRSPSRLPDIAATSSELHPESWAQPRGTHHETAIVESPWMRNERRRSRSPMIVEELPYDPSNQSHLRPRPRTVEISPAPPVVIHPPVGSGTRPRSRPLSTLSPLSLALRSSIRRRDSIDTPYQSDTSSLAHQRRHSLEPLEGEEIPDVELESHHETVPPTVSSEVGGAPLAPQVPEANTTSDALAGPWTRDITSLHNLTTI